MKTPSLLQLVKGAFIALIAFTLGSTAAQAQANRTWVSGVGDDANPCSRTAPCKTFAGAISKTAASGEINVLDPGGFGGVTITKSITIDGGGNLSGVLVASTNGITINAAATDVVTIRNLDIDGLAAVGGSLNGINILNAGTVSIERCVIYGFTGASAGNGVLVTNASEVNIENTSIKTCLVGVNIAPTAVCGVTIKNTTIRNCTGGAVFARPNAATGAAVNISKSSLNDSLFGLRANDNVKAVLDDCVLAGNNNNGVTAVSGGAAVKVMVNRCTINDTGGFGVVASGALTTVFISNNAIFNNVTGVGTLSGGVMTSLGNNNINGNTTDGSPKP